MGMVETDLTWAPNAKEDRSGPKYRLFSQKDVRSVLPNTPYKCKSSINCRNLALCGCSRSQNSLFSPLLLRELLEEIAIKKQTLTMSIILRTDLTHRQNIILLRKKFSDIRIPSNGLILKIRSDTTSLDFIEIMIIS